MEGGKGVAKNEGKDEIMVTVTPRDAEGPTFGSSSSHLNKGDVHNDGKENHNSRGDNDKKNGPLIVMCCVCLCLVAIILLLSNNAKKIGACFIRCIFVCLVGILIVSLTVPNLKDTLIWGLELWKWNIFVLVILYGGLISNCLITIPHAIFISVMNLRLLSLLLVYEMKKSARPFIWLGLILLVWVLLINPGVERSKDTTKVLDHVTNALVGGLVVAAIWFAKSLLIKLLALSFQDGRFLHRIEKTSFKLDVMETLLNDPSLEKRSGKSNGLHLYWEEFRHYWEEHTRKIEDLNEEQSLLRIEREKMFARIREGHIFKMIRNRLSGILVDKEDRVQKDMETTRNSKVEDKAEADAEKIFGNVAKTNSAYICKEDLRRCLEEEDVDRLLQLIPQATETEKITSSDLKDWMVKSYKGFEALAHSLDYTGKTLGKLDRLASGIAIVIGIIVWCLMMGIFTTRMLVLISTQILAASFMFGNTIKTVFEAIIFVFLMHPFDVGDQCVIDEQQMLVEEISILCTIFLRNDMQKIFYPNSVLFTKPISNSFRNPETDDSVEFNIDLSTSPDKIESLEKEIEKYVEGNSRYWLPNHSVVVEDIDNKGNLTMSLSVTHNINFQSSGEKKSRRSKLILKLREILEDLGIKYRLLPQEVHVKYI